MNPDGISMVAPKLHKPRNAAVVLTSRGRPVRPAVKQQPKRQYVPKGSRVRPWTCSHRKDVRATVTYQQYADKWALVDDRIQPDWSTYISPLMGAVAHPKAARADLDEHGRKLFVGDAGVYFRGRRV